MESVKCIAVDWSGSQDEEGQLQGIWLAVAEARSLTRLKNGLTRDEAIATLVKEIESGGPLFIGLDFAFSFPQWYVTRLERCSARGLWDLAGEQGEEWLRGNTWPFWGREGPYRKLPENLTENLRFRQTDEDHRNSHPKSVFQINGAGAVGTGTIRGLPKLACLQDAGAAIWPFDAPNPDGPNVIEIYPRVFYGTDVTNNNRVSGRDARNLYLDTHYAGLGRHWRDTMIGSGDAFDAGVSALVMSAHADELQGLKRATQEPKSVEGEIWSPSSKG